MSLYVMMSIPFMLTLFAFILQRSHLLMTLFCLEGMLLSLVLMIPSTLHASNMLSAPTIALIMLTMGACEASLGLSLMVNMSRMYGTDMFSSINMNKC